jgi:hypothetical protein
LINNSCHPGVNFYPLFFVISDLSKEIISSPALSSGIIKRKTEPPEGFD